MGGQVPPTEHPLDERHMLQLSDTARMPRKASPDISFREFQAFTFGSQAELETVFGSVAAAQERWNAVRDQFLEQWDLWGRPEAWWLFEPDVPEELRAGPPAVITYADADRWRMLDAARQEYLRSLDIDPRPERRHTPFGSD